MVRNRRATKPETPASQPPASTSLAFFSRLYLADIFAECYQKAVPKETFPVDCPFSQEQVLNWDYFPENSF